MKVIAIYQVDYLDPKTNKIKVGHPGSTIDLPKDTALALLAGSNPAVRRLSEAEQALDRARAEAMSRPRADADAEGEDGDDTVTTEGTVSTEAAVEVDSADAGEVDTKTTRKRGSRSAGDY